MASSCKKLPSSGLGAEAPLLAPKESSNTPPSESSRPAMAATLMRSLSQIQAKKATNSGASAATAPTWEEVE